MQIVRGDLLHCRWMDAQIDLEYLKDAALLIDKSGRIKAKSDFKTLNQLEPEASIIDYRGKWLIPGFLDTHVHFPQLNMIGQMAPSLLPWLNNYTFPNEMAFQGRGNFVIDAAHQFVDELLANGTSLACVYSSSNYEATDVLFEVFAQRGLRGIIGKASMDRNAPPQLLVPCARDLAEQALLLQRWQGFEQRLAVALTARFAPSCTPELMSELGQLHKKFPDTYIQTHYAENLGELAWVQQLFPNNRDYLEVYESFDLVGPRTILAHGIHLDTSAMARLAKSGAIVSHCPSSNLFLGSGLFNWQAMKNHSVRVALGSDVAAGTSFSLWQTMNEANKVAALQGLSVSAKELFGAATLSAAKDLGFDALGSFEPGYEADFQVIDPTRRPLLNRRVQNCESNEELLSAFIHLCDESCLNSVWIRGKKIWG